MRVRSWLAGTVALATAACQTVQTTDDAAVDLNRAFARARDEITLLNVLRASERQPLQFSTISSVQGAVRAGASIRIPFINLVGAGREAISPEISLSSRNPTVSIAPLATREFIQGISRPLSPGIIDDLLIQGWPLDVVLGLTVGGVVCGGDNGKLNHGDDPEEDQRFLQAFRNVSDFGFELGQPTPFAQLRMTGKDALAALREGAGEQRRVANIKPLAPRSDGSVDVLVELVTPGQARIKGIDFREVCAGGGVTTQHAPEKALLPTANVKTGGVLMRSVFGIFQYLGKAHAADLRRQLDRCRGAGEPPLGAAPLFQVEVLCAGTAPRSRPVASTKFEGRRFFVRRSGERPAGDRTLETLSLLTYLVDLQTSETAVKASVPFVAITQP